MSLFWKLDPIHFALMLYKELSKGIPITISGKCLKDWQLSLLKKLLWAFDQDEIFFFQ
jgi:hypothetical protein